MAVSMEEAEKPAYKKFGDEPKKLKLRKGAKFNFDFVKIAEKLGAAGCSSDDIGYVLGVSKASIEKWKQRYPQFAQACKNAKEMAIQQLVAKGIRGAVGYDYEDVDETYRTIETDEGTMERLVERKVHKKHQSPNSSLIIFFLTNLARGEYQSAKKIEVTERRASIDLTGRLESDDIMRLAGALLKTKQIESKVVCQE